MAYNDPWICADCGLQIHWQNETMYMVHDALWLSVMPDDTGHLCPLCLEARLGRHLQADDFTHVPINDYICWRLCWIRHLGRDVLLAQARSRRERLDRRAAQARRRRQLKRWR